MIEFFYNFVSSLEEYNDAYGYHTQYFLEEGGFLTAFLIALLSAVIITFLFYFLICNLCNSLSKFYIWIIGLFIAIGGNLLLTKAYVVGGENNDTGEYSGFYSSIEQHTSNLNEEFSKNNEERKKINDAAETILLNLREEGDEEYAVVDMLYLNNTLWCLTLYILISILIKGTTKYGIAIPCAWPRKLHI